MSNPDQRPGTGQPGPSEALRNPFQVPDHTSPKGSQDKNPGSETGSRTAPKPTEVFPGRNAPSQRTERPPHSSNVKTPGSYGRDVTRGDGYRKPPGETSGTTTIGGATYDAGKVKKVDGKKPASGGTAKHRRR